MNSSRRRTATLAAGLAGLLATAGCGIFGSGPSAKEEATALAAALSAGRPDRVTYDGATGAQARELWTRTVQGLGTSRPKVTVGDVTESVLIPVV